MIQQPVLLHRPVELVTGARIDNSKFLATVFATRRRPRSRLVGAVSALKVLGAVAISKPNVFRIQGTCEGFWYCNLNDSFDTECRMVCVFLVLFRSSREVCHFMKCSFPSWLVTDIKQCQFTKTLMTT